MVKTPNYKEKYVEVFRMAKALVAMFYKNYSGFFKMMSFDKEDIQQEVDYLTWREIKKFEAKKYPPDSKINLKYYIKLQIQRKIYNLLAENTNDMFIPLDQKDIDKEIDEMDYNSGDNTNAQITEPDYIHFSDSDVQTLLKRFSKNELEYHVVKEKIVNNRTFAEIQDLFDFETRNKGEYLYNNVIDRITQATGGKLDKLLKF